MQGLRDQWDTGMQAYRKSRVPRTTLYFMLTMQPLVLRCITFRMTTYGGMLLLLVLLGPISCTEGRRLLQSQTKFSVAAMPYYVAWVEQGCAIGRTGTSECAAYTSSAGSTVKFPATTDIIMPTAEEVEFQTSAAATMLLCSTSPPPPSCQVAVEGPYKGTVRT